MHLDTNTESIDIGRVAFYKCSALTEVDFGGNIATIGGSAFDKCTSLKTILVTDRLTKIGLSAFYGATDLSEFNLPDSVEDIGDYAFYNTRLSKVHIPNNANYTTIGEGTFHFSNIQTLTLPSNIKKLGRCAFSNNSISTVDLGNVETIESEAFNANSLSSVYLPKTLTSLESDSFKNNSQLKSFTGDSVFNPVKFGDTGESSSYLVCNPVTSQQGDDLVTTYTLLCVASGTTTFAFPSNITKISD